MNSTTENLLLNNESIAGILDFLPYPFLISATESDGIHIKFSNKKFKEEIGYTPDEIKTLDDWFVKAYPDKHYRSEVKTKWNRKILDAIRHKRDYVLEHAHITTKNNGKMWYEVKSSLAGNLQFVAFVNIDDVIGRDEKLRKLNENKNKILSILGHDLKSPLQNVAKLVDLLIDGNLSHEEFTNNLGVVRQLSSKTLQFIDTTLTWTRNNFENHETEPEEFNLFDFINGVIGLYARDFEFKNITPIINIPGDVTLMSDREIIHIAFRNLISNAIKFSPAETPIIISYHNRKNNHYLTVTDAGEGMSSEIIDRILTNKSNKTSDKGFGIGLRLCNEVLNRIHGSLEIKSQRGKGTAVSIVLPQE